MRESAILLLFLAACGSEATNDDAARPIQTATLTGLYRSAGEGRLCMIARGGETRFGLVAPGCSGAGIAVRRGDRLELAMAGEIACALDARIDGGEIAFASSPPGGCAYYCAAGATLGGLAFEKVGGTEADALGARDLVGDPLCG